MIVQSKQWVDKATRMLDGDESAYLGIEALKDFIKSADKVVFERSHLLTGLKTELKAAKQWKSSFDEKGFEVGGAKNEDLEPFIEQSKSIKVNLREFIDAVVQLSTNYCLCRQLYFGEMVGCDTCEDWYHFQCVGLNTNRAEKCDKYICPRCSLQDSFKHSANAVAGICNKWMRALDHFKARELTLGKVRL